MYQLWCTLLHAEPYCGVDTHLLDTGQGHDANVVLGLIEGYEVKTGSTVTFDNQSVYLTPIVR